MFRKKKYLSGQIESSGKFPFAAEVLKFQTIIQGVLVNKTNHISVFFTPEETTFDLSANFGGLTTKM